MKENNRVDNKNVNKLVKNELDKAFDLDVKCNDPFVLELSLNNVRYIETILFYNSMYNQFMDEELILSLNDLDLLDNEIAKKPNRYNKYKFNSVTYIYKFNELYKSKQLDNEKYRNLVYIILRKISSENRTRVNLDEIEVIAYNICKKYKTPNDLLDELISPYGKKTYEDCKYELIELISRAYEYNSKDGKRKGNRNFSLATKFCHYMCFNLFEDTVYQDLYSIYDSIVKDRLKDYYEVYVNEPLDKKLYTYDNMSKDIDFVNIYQNYQAIIDKIISTLPNDKKISRNGFDHIIWYTNK